MLFLNRKARVGLDILQRLHLVGRQTGPELAEGLGEPLEFIYSVMKVLRYAGLVREERRIGYCRIESRLRSTGLVEYLGAFGLSVRMNVSLAETGASNRAVAAFHDLLGPIFLIDLMEVSE